MGVTGSVGSLRGNPPVKFNQKARFWRSQERLSLAALGSSTFVQDFNGSQLAYAYLEFHKFCMNPWSTILADFSDLSDPSDPSVFKTFFHPKRAISFSENENGPRVHEYFLKSRGHWGQRGHSGSAQNKPLRTSVGFVNPWPTHPTLYSKFRQSVWLLST
jgi:hypothetical protein